jgi:hypothetical protein
MVNIIAHGFEKVNKIELDCQSSRLSTHFFHIFFILSLPYPHPQNSTKNRPAKKQGVVGAGQRNRTSISFQEEKYSGN